VGERLLVLFFGGRLEVHAYRAVPAGAARGLVEVKLPANSIEAPSVKEALKTTVLRN
jgi:hypothetical protein